MSATAQPSAPSRPAQRGSGSVGMPAASIPKASSPAVATLRPRKASEVPTVTRTGTPKPRARSACAPIDQT
ncbi:MAG: hypothetical protein VX494_09220, partial [Actinomycetota bacterium]|nr:hypothetical protein [Actinomycetota bacterium]